MDAREQAKKAGMLRLEQFRKKKADRGSVRTDSILADPEETITNVVDLELEKDGKNKEDVLLKVTKERDALRESFSILQARVSNLEMALSEKVRSNVASYDDQKRLEEEVFCMMNETKESPVEKFVRGIKAKENLIRQLEGQILGLEEDRSRSQSLLEKQTNELESMRRSLDDVNEQLEQTKDELIRTKQIREGIEGHPHDTDLANASVGIIPSSSTARAEASEEVESLREMLENSKKEAQELHEKLRIAVKKGKSMEEKKKKLEALLQDKEVTEIQEVNQLKEQLASALAEIQRMELASTESMKLVEELATKTQLTTDLNGQLSETLAKLAEAEKQASIFKHEAENLRATMVSNEQALQESRDTANDQEMQEKIERIESLEYELAAVTAEHKFSIQDKEKLEQEKNELTFSLHALKAEKDDMLKLIHEKDMLVSSLQQTVEDRSAEIAGSAKGMEELQQQFKEQEKLLEGMNEMMQSSLDEKEEIKKKLKQAVKRGQKIEKDKEEAEERLAEVQSQLQQMAEKQEEVVQKSAQVADMLEKFELLERENSALKGAQNDSLNKTLEDLESLQAKIVAIEGELSLQSGALEAAREQAESLLRENVTLQNMQAETEARESEALSRLKLVEEKSQELLKEVQHTKEREQEVRAQLDIEQSQRSDMDGTILALKEESVQHKQALMEVQKALSEREAELSDLREKTREFDDAQGTAASRVRELEELCASRNASVAELEENCKSLSEKAKEYKEQLRLAVKKGKELEKQNKAAEAQLEELSHYQEQVASGEQALEVAHSEQKKLEMLYHELEAKFNEIEEEKQSTVNELSFKLSEAQNEALLVKNNLESLLQEKTASLEELENKNADLSAALCQQEELCKQLREESSVMQEQISTLQASLEEKSNAIDPSEYAEGMESLQREVERSQDLLSQHQAETSELREKLRAAVRKGKSIEKEKHAMEQEHNLLMDKIAALEHDREVTSMELESVKNVLLDSKEQLKKKEVECYDLHETAKSSIGALEEIQQQYQDLVAHLPDSEHVMRLEVELADSTQKLQQLEVTLREKEEQLHSLMGMLEEKTKGEENVQALRTEIDSAQDSLQIALARSEDLESERVSLWQELDTQKETITDLNSRHESLQHELNDKSVQLEEAQQKVIQLEVQVSQLREFTDSHSKDTEDLASQHAQLLELLEEREQELQSANERLDTVASELADREAELAEAQSSAAEAIALKTKALTDSANSAASLASAMERTEELAQALDGAKSEFDRQLASVNGDYRARLDKLMAEYSAVQQKLASVENLAEQKLTEHVEEYKARAGAAESRSAILEQQLQQMKQSLQVQKEREDKLIAAKPSTGEVETSGGPFQRRSTRPYDPEANTSANAFEESDFKPFTGVRGYQVSRLPPAVQQWVGMVDRYSILSCVTFRREPALRVLLLVYLVVVHVILFLYFAMRSLR